MHIALKKFGTTLTSRQLGKESYAAFQPSLKEVPKDEKLEVDFDGVTIFSPSWGDEFLSRLIDDYGERIVFLNTQNPSVKETLKFLEKVGNKNFNILS